MANAPQAWAPRIATEQDIPDIAVLIPLSVRGLQGPFYSQAQMEAALAGVFSVDRQLVRDRTYFVVEDAGRIVGCGGWSRRRATYGGDAVRKGENPEVDPATRPARIRAFFVHPGWARRGIARSLMAACEEAVVAAGFRDVTISSTLAGEPLYASLGYREVERYGIDLPGGLSLPCVGMARSLAGPVEPVEE